MNVRTFGAIRGAGTQVREVQPDQPIQQGPFGTSLLVGIFRSGPVGEVVELEGGRSQFTRIFGGLTPDSDAPLAATQFYDLARGGGRLWALRVTDGSEVAAALKLFDRNVDTSVLEVTPPAKVAAHVATLAAHNGGRWAGRRKVLAGDVSLPGAISGQALTTGVTMLENAWAGATLRLVEDDASWSGTVESNTAAGVVTISGAFSAAILAGSDGRWTLELENVDTLTGAAEFLAVEVVDGGEDPSGRFGLTTWRDGGAVKSWLDLSTDSAGDAYWLSAIEDDANQWEVNPTDYFAGDVEDELQRPANFAEIPAPGGVAANVVHLQVVRWARTSGAAGDPFLDTVNDLTWGSDPRPCTVVLTWSDATNYSVAVTMEDGTVIAGLPAGVIDVAYVAEHPWLPGWTITSGTTAPQLADTLTIYARPLPADLAKKGGKLVAAAADSEGDVLKSWGIVSNDHDSITVAGSVDLSSDLVAPVAPTLTGSIAGDYALAGGETFIFTAGDRAAITLTESGLGAGTHTATAVAAEFNALELARAGAAVDCVIEFGVSAADKLTATLLQDFGGDSLITLGAGTLNAIVGYTTSQEGAGTAGKICRVQWRQELGGGYDGIAAIAAADYVDAWQVGIGTPLDAMIEANTGLIRCAMPGVYTASAQAAALAWAYSTNSIYYAGLEPSSAVDEASAIAWHRTNLAIGPEQDYHRAYFPSTCKIANPYGAGFYECPVLGLVLGLEARMATRNEGYQFAPAGLDYLISPTAKSLPLTRRLDGEALNSYGLIEVRMRGSSIYLWGDRVAAYGGRLWAHKRAAVSHIGRVLLTNTTALVFRKIDAYTFAAARRQVRSLFKPWYVSGWFDDEGGPAFEHQVEIKCDAENNPAAERDAGNLHVDVSFNVVGTAERVIFTLGPRGFTEAS